MQIQYILTYYGYRQNKKILIYNFKRILTNFNIFEMIYH
jgi:hypothetical protein